MLNPEVTLKMVAKLLMFSCTIMVRLNTIAKFGLMFKVAKFRGSYLVDPMIQVSMKTYYHAWTLK